MTHHSLEFRTTDIDDLGFSFHEELTEVLGNVDVQWSSSDNKLVVDWLDGDLKTKEDPASVIRGKVGQYIIEQLKT